MQNNSFATRIYFVTTVKGNPHLYFESISILLYWLDIKILISEDNYYLYFIRKKENEFCKLITWYDILSEDATLPRDHNIASAFIF